MDKVNILLVDDQPAKLLSYEVILEDLGENLIKATSAREALEQLLRNEIAIVLTDVSMPETDGFELARMIREHPRFERTAIIFVSAVHLTSPDLLRGYAAGAVDYLPVPLVPELMRAKVRVFAELYRKSRELERLNAELEHRVAERTADLALANAQLELRVEERTREREAALAQVHEMQKMESIGQLTGGIAHDFNNLLMAIMANLELLQKRLQDNPSATRLLNSAMAGAERGVSLTKRMLAFARRQELKPVNVQLKALIQGMEEMLQRSLGPTVAVAISVDSDIPPVVVDPNQLELALLNLALNARDAMPDGGQLRIEAHRDQRPAPGGGNAEFVRISIHDTGIGMDEGTLKRAAEPFFTTKGVGKGTGLGLSMVQGLVGQSGGTFRIHSRPGVGTCVHLWLPLPTDVATESHAARPPGDGALPSVEPRRVLAVDDDPLVLASTAAMLEDLGHIVVTASSGAEALELLQLETVDVVVTDYAMPVLDGLRLARQIEQRWPSTVVIIASGYAEQPEPEHHTFVRVSKPFNQVEIGLSMHRALGLRKVLPKQPSATAP